MRSSGKNPREPPAYLYHFSKKIDSLYSKGCYLRVESVLADLVGLEHVVDGGHWVVGLDDVDVEDVEVLKSSFNSTE